MLLGKIVQFQALVRAFQAPKALETKAYQASKLLETEAYQASKVLETEAYHVYISA